VSRYYPKSIQKVAYVRWSHVHLPVQFVERTSGGPPLYIRTTNSSVRPLDLVYVRSLRISVWPLLFSKGLKHDLVGAKGFGSHKTPSLKTFF
jgi:hypothetical protein